MQRQYWASLLGAGLVLGGALTSLGATPAAATDVRPAGNIDGLHHIKVVSSTIDTVNGDTNPYAVTLDTYAGTSTAPNPYFGDMLVSNFSNSAGVSGAGTTIEAINPATGAKTTFAASANGPVGIAISPKGPPWVANFGQVGTDGNVEVLKPNGQSFPNGGGIVTGPGVDGPWGQAFVPYGSTPAFLVPNALNGTLYAMYGFSPPNFNTTTQFVEIGQGLAHTGTTAANVVGPQGMVYDSKTGLVYVTDGADNSIRAYQWAGPATADQGTGRLIYRGRPLAQPAGITIDPLNGDLLVVNQKHNTLVELALSGHRAHVVGVRVLDRTPVNPKTGAGSALFGVTAVASGQHLMVFYTDDNTNTLNVLY